MVLTSADYAAAETQLKIQNLQRLYDLAKQQNNTQAMNNLQAQLDALGAGQPASAPAPTTTPSSGASSSFFSPQTLYPQSIYIPPEQKSVLFTGAQGNVVGIQDPIAQMSYAIAPTPVQEVKQLEQQRAISLLPPPIPRAQEQTFTIPPPSNAVSSFLESNIRGIGDFLPKAEAFKESVYKNIGIAPSPLPSSTDKSFQGFLGYEAGFFGEVGKTVLRLPGDVGFQLGGAALKGIAVGEAGALAISNKDVRESLGTELIRSGSETMKFLNPLNPQGIRSQFNPGTPQGLVNIGLLAVGIKGAASEAAAARAATRLPESLTFTESETLRISLPEKIIDTSKVEGQIFPAKGKPSLFFGKGTQEFLFQEQQFTVKGGGEVFGPGSAKPTTFDTLGFGKVTEAGSEATSFTRSISPKGATSFRADITQTEPLVSSPFQSFQEVTRTAALPKGAPVSMQSFVPESVTVGVSRESFLGNLEGKNIIGKDLFTESGQLAQSSRVFETRGVTRPASEFQDITFAKARANPDVLKTQGTDIGGTTLRSSAMPLDLLPSQETALKLGIRQQVQEFSVQKATEGSVRATAAAAGTGFSIGAQRQANNMLPSISQPSQTARPGQQLIPSLKLTPSAGTGLSSSLPALRPKASLSISQAQEPRLQVKPLTRQLPTQRPSLKIDMLPTQKPIIVPKTGAKIGQTPATKPATALIPAQKQGQVPQFKTPTQPQSPSRTDFFPHFPKGGASLGLPPFPTIKRSPYQPSRKRGKRSKGQKFGYNQSVEAAVFHITAKGTKPIEFSGLVGRPIVVK